MRLIMASAALAATGCTTLAADMPHAVPPEKCDAQPAQSLIGRQATAALAAEAQRLSGAETVRWLQPGQAVTMEYRYNRLNILLDKDNRVESINCG